MIGIPRQKNAIRHTPEDRIINTMIIILTTFVFIVTVYPFYYVLIMSFNNGNDAMRGGIYLWPRVFTMENYGQFLNDSKWISAIFVSFARTVLGTGLGVLFTCMVAYAMSFEDLKLRKFYYGIMIICMYFSGGLIPYYLTLRQIGLLNNFLVYIIPMMFSIYYMILAISFFQAIPRTLYESAYLDGANDAYIYVKIVLPLSLPLLATLALFMAVNQWNSWMDTAFYCTGQKNLRTLAYLLRDLIVSNETGVQRGWQAISDVAAGKMKAVTSKSIQMAAMMISILPIICVYPFLQKYFVSGIMLGAVKG
ncbi:MAG: carbohydrate ABC transporter permease [Eubacteriales bacterium]|nr:carbohydrate ABC transporter permease [Eubacteriales bacterium]